MKYFIYKFSIFIIPILFILLIVNYIGDSANLFKTGYELKMAEIIGEGKYITNIDNYDERIFQKEIISQMNHAPNTIVLGASRSMLINTVLLKESDFFNNSVSGASLEDYIAIYQIYKEKNKIPKKIIIDIEPYMFNKNNGQTRWKSIEEFYYHFKNDNKKKLSANNKYKELFSLSYFQSSAKKIPNLISGNNKPKSTDKKFNKTNTKLTDGSLVYNESYRDASKSEIERKVKSFLSGGLYGLGKFNSIDENIWTEFDILINDMKNNNIKIQFFLCPYHPKVYNRIKDNYPMVLKSENLIVKFAEEHDIKIYGSFNPNKIGFDETFFYDGMHCKEAGIKKILQMND